MIAVILAGGKGTRLQSVNTAVPKPMIPVCGKPVLLHQIETLHREGISDFILVVGYLKEQIIAFFKDGKTFGVNISYFHEDVPLGTAGALLKLNLTDDFLLCNGDLIFDFSLQRMLSFHQKKRALGTIFSHPNSHPGDSTLLDVDDDCRVRGLLFPESKPVIYENICSAGIYLLSPAALKHTMASGCSDLDRNILAPMARKGGLYAYRSPEYVRDMGTPDRLTAVVEDVRCGVVKRRNLTNTQRAVFLDRDGTVNEHKGYITTPEVLELLPGVSAAIRKIHTLGYLVILVTNQPVVARGECTLKKLRLIHNKLETLLGADGAYLDAIYCCPHHPDAGFEGENKAYKIPCDCRKPAPGMLLKAAKEYHIDLTTSYMVGDSMRDVRTAINAGCIPILLSGKNVGDVQNEETKKAFHMFDRLIDFSVYLSSK